MKVGGYTLDLYCDTSDPAVKKFHGYNAFHVQYIGRNEAQCLRKAKSDGWMIRGYLCYCPTCANTRRLARQQKKEAGSV